MVWISTSDAESAAIQELIMLPPRAAAIVGVALVHARIAERVAEKFPVDGNTKRGLFKENGPLAGYDVQCRMAYTFGLISKRAYNDTLRIGRMRNMFAHRLDVTDFEHADIAPDCKGLELVDRHLFERGTKVEDRSISTKVYIEDLAGNLADNRKRFQLTAMLLTSGLTPILQVGGRERVFPRAPI